MARVTVTQRARPEDRDALFTGLQWNDPKTADVNLLLQDLSVVGTHRIKLGVSPVLRGVLSSLEARLDARPCISLQEFNTEAVTCLLNFIYTGEVVLEKKSTIQEEFMKLCKTLRLNPSITKTERRQEADSSDADSVHNIQPGDPDQAEDENTKVLELADERQSDKTQDNSIRTDPLPLSSDNIEEESPPCDTIDTLILENSDEETPEHISDFLSSIMSNPSQEGDEGESSDEHESTFTMPTSFDIPAEYISEMVPRASSTVSNPFQTSDEEFSESLTPTPTPDLQNKLDDVTIKNEEYSEKVIYENTKRTVVDEERKSDTKLKHERDIKVENVDKVVPSSNRTVEKSESASPVKDEVEQITYQKSIGHKKFKEKKTHNPKMDRRTLQAKLFGESDSEGEGRKKEGKRSKESKAQSDSESSSQRPAELEKKSVAVVSHNPVETKEDLEQKKRRMKKKLRQAEAEQRRDSEKSKLNKDSSNKESSKNKETKNREQRGSPQKTKKHECHSLCSCVKRALNEGDDDWLVPDNQVTYRTSSSDSDTPLPSVKVLDKRPKKVNIGDSSTEDGDQDEDSADEEEQRKLEAERKVALALRGGGDVLSRMRGKLSVKIQNSCPVVIDLWQYQAQLDASDTSGSDYRKPAAAGDSDSDSGSDVSIPRGKRFSPVKLASNDEKDRERKKKKKKLTKLKMDPPRKDFNIDEVEVWTPAMYQKWDKSGRPKEKKRKHKHDSDSDSRSKGKNLKLGFNRSISFETGGKKTVGGDQAKVLQRSSSSVPTLESLGIAHNYGMPGQIGKSTALSNLPKIPKLKKQENV